MGPIKHGMLFVGPDLKRPSGLAGGGIMGVSAQTISRESSLTALLKATLSDKIRLHGIPHHRSRYLIFCLDDRPRQCQCRESVAALEMSLI